MGTLKGLLIGEVLGVKEAFFLVLPEIYPTYLRLVMASGGPGLRHKICNRVCLISISLDSLFSRD